MSLDLDDEILQDFMVEAGEILELLSEQLVELEEAPDDSELLNAIFRGFHTIKGGAGFLSLGSLVNVCHVAENVFDLLRQGKRKVEAGLMDVIFKTLDSLNAMFVEIRQGQEPASAKPTLLSQLEALAQVGQDLPTAVIEEASKPQEPKEKSIPEEPKIEPAVAAKAELGADSSIEEKKVITEVKPAVQTKLESKLIIPDGPDLTSSIKEIIDNGDGDITEDEFEKLLDLFQGPAAEESTQDTVGGKSKSSVTVDSVKKTGKNASVKKENLTVVAGEGDLITEAEFESLLDELQNVSPSAGSKPFKKATVAAKAVTSKKIEVDKPVVVVQEEKVDIQIAKKPAQDLLVNKEVNTVAEATVRVDTSRLDEIMNMVGELVLVRNRLVKIKGSVSDDSLVKAVDNLDIVTGGLQMAVMKTRMQPVKKVFGRFPRVVRDLARNLHKEVSLEMEGEDTDLDKNLVEGLSDPLVHLVRNSVDHGIESPEERIKAGKPSCGKIVLAAEQAGDHILLSITDDGRGMDAEVLRESAVDRGIMDIDTAARLDDKDCYNLIFMPGFSTKKEISDISGRGVGMDVVKTKINQLNGSIEIMSQKGLGSRINIKVPLTLAILPTLMVTIGEQIFALPLTCVNEIFNLDLSKTNTVDGQLVIIVRGKAVPLFYLKKWLSGTNYINKMQKNEQVDEQDDEITGQVVLVSIGTQIVAFVVDGLLGQEEVVIKALGDALHGIAGMAGATITGDGKIAMILDVPGLLNNYA